MRALWNTFNTHAAWLAAALTVTASVYVGTGLPAGYRYSAWWSASLHGPMFAFGLYVYLAVAFNIASTVSNWWKASVLAAWVLLGSVIPYFIGYGLVLVLTVLGLAIPELTYLPLGLGTFDVGIHVTWLGFLAALAISSFFAVQSLRSHTPIRESTDA